MWHTCTKVGATHPTAVALHLSDQKPILKAASQEHI